MGITAETLPLCRPDQLESRSPDQAWLIRSLWTKSAVGIIGGAPKCCKSWLGLEMAVSIASATPCLDCFAVDDPGPVLVFLAEDAAFSVRARIEALCAHRGGIKLADLDLHVITAPTLRLDLPADQKRLTATLAAVRPRLLLLDPLVRLHRLDENSAADISSLLGFVREMQRVYDTAIILVHHASKKHRAQPGKSLRGSSDLHAFGDSNAYLTRRAKHIVLTLEHRSAGAPEPIDMELVTQKDGTGTHLKIVSEIQGQATYVSLRERILGLLNHANGPLTRTALREQLKVNNQRLGQALTQLEQKKLALRTSKGWITLKAQPNQPADEERQF